MGPGAGRDLQAMVWSDNFILRAMGDWDWDPSGYYVQMGEELGVEFRTEAKQKSGWTEPSELNPRQWEEANAGRPRMMAWVPFRGIWGQGEGTKPQPSWAQGARAL